MIYVREMGKIGCHYIVIDIKNVISISLANWYFQFMFVYLT